MRIVSKPRNKSAERMQELACLPVFFTLKGKRVVVVGGSDAAAWKAELLLAAGAHVALYCAADAMGADMHDLCAAAHLTHFDVDWRKADFANAALAIADLGVDVAPEFIALARGAAVPINIIDKPAFCDFQFGAIVNRSPVVVGISTAGAAPILGQAVRRRIEAVLPKALSAWGKLARGVRAKVMRRLPAGAVRRAFWEAFVARAFASDWQGKPCADDLLDHIGADTEGAKGCLTIVGAGPGDPELLTLKAMRALQAADEIFHDDAIGAPVLELGRREAKRHRWSGQCLRPTRHMRARLAREVRAGKNIVIVQSGAGEVFAMAPDVRLHFVPGVQESGSAMAGFELGPHATPAIDTASSKQVALTH